MCVRSLEEDSALSIVGILFCGIVLLFFLILCDGGLVIVDDGLRDVDSFVLGSLSFNLCDLPDD